MKKLMQFGFKRLVWQNFSGGNQNQGSAKGDDANKENRFEANFGLPTTKEMFNVEPRTLDESLDETRKNIAQIGEKALARGIRVVKNLVDPNIQEESKVEKPTNGNA